MAILRKQQRNQYTVIDQSIFKDKTLSNKALGMLCRMLSLPDGWEFSVEGLATLSTDGVSAVRSQLNELEEHGYLARNYVRGEGKISGIEYVVSETPKCDFLKSENLISENLISENNAQSNTKESITDLSNTNGIIYTEFENLWSLYPKKQGKASAFRHYQKARKSGAVYEEIEQGVLAYTEYIRANNIDMQYVKMGSTFFSQKAWNDDWTIRHSRQESRRELFARLYEEHRDDI